MDRKLNNIEEVDSLTEAEAFTILERQKELLNGLPAYGLDDTGDYLYAAVTNFNRLFLCYWEDDGEGFLDKVKDFLREPVDEWLGCDGDVRFEVFADNYEHEEV